MGSMPDREKRYVGVEASIDLQGFVRPTAVVWPDGRRFTIDKIGDVRRVYSAAAGAAGVRYSIKVGPCSSFLYYENPRWFVEAKVRASEPLD